MSEPMSDLDLDDLRRRVERTPSDDDDLQAIPKSVMLALIDRIKELEAERDEREVGNALNVAAHMYEVRRRREAEARLARVTDDSMAERLAEIPLWWKKRMDDGYVSTGARTEREVAADALAAIRAVAADEQTEWLEQRKRND